MEKYNTVSSGGGGGNNTVSSGGGGGGNNTVSGGGGGGGNNTVSGGGGNNTVSGGGGGGGNNTVSGGGGDNTVSGGGGGGDIATEKHHLSTDETRAKLKEKLNMLKTRRTGIERRKLVETYKHENKGKGKNVMKHFAEDTVKQLLNKFGIIDSNIEKTLIRDISNGKIKDHNQLTQLIVKRLQQMAPQGPGSSETKISKPSVLPPSQINLDNRKVLKKPSENLLN
jgi:hypothetical protein